jgi:DNA-binding response OmpR family regulator
MYSPLGKPFVILHFCCNPSVQTNHGRFLSSLGYCVIGSNNGFETIELSASGEIDAVVLELDRNHSDVLLIAREIKRARASLPTIVVVHATQTRDGLDGLADALVPEEMGSGLLVKSLEEVLARSRKGYFPLPGTAPAKKQIGDKGQVSIPA